MSYELTKISGEVDVSAFSEEQLLAYCSYGHIVRSTSEGARYPLSAILGRPIAFYEDKSQPGKVFLYASLYDGPAQTNVHPRNTRLSIERGRSYKFVVKLGTQVSLIDGSTEVPRMYTALLPATRDDNLVKKSMVSSDFESKVSEGRFVLVCPS